MDKCPECGKDILVAYNSDQKACIDPKCKYAHGIPEPFTEDTDIYPASRRFIPNTPCAKYWCHWAGTWNRLSSVQHDLLETLSDKIDSKDKQIDDLIALLKDAKLTLEHYLPPGPDHCCGHPDAVCDSECMEHMSNSKLICEMSNVIWKHEKQKQDETSRENFNGMSERTVDAMYEADRNEGTE